MNPTKTEAIKNFLKAKTHPDLATLYNYGMEVQVNVAQDGGQRIESEYKGRNWNGWTDGLSTWKPIRIPWNAKTNPEYEDSIITFDLAEHAEGIGLTGWQWQKRQSEWVGFDYDAIAGHSERHTKKLSTDELNELRRVVEEVEWVTVRSSTSGKGIHLYVFFDPPIPTENHTEHAALARAVLGMLSARTGYDFTSKVDALGGILWVWHRKMIMNEGLALLKQGSFLHDVPENWREHIPVIKGKSKKCIPSFIRDEDKDIFEDVANKQSVVPLDQEHMKLISWLRDNNLNFWYDQDRHCLTTHTAYLAKAHEDLSLKGVFKTIATGAQWGHDTNCYLFSLRNGGWVVRRFNPGVAEADTWFQDISGWTKTYFNIIPDFDTACRACGGLLNEKGAYIFPEAESALNAVNMLNVHVDIAPYALTRRCILRKTKEGRLIVDIDRENEDAKGEMRDWLIPDGSKKVWQKVIPTSLNKNSPETEVQSFDDILRHLVTEDGNVYGWMINNEGQWRRGPTENAKFTLAALGQEGRNISMILGQCVMKSWVIVNRPFEEEYPAGRIWNKDAVQLAIVPNKNSNRTFPSWSKILNQIGKNLTAAVQNDDWCQNSGILTGADYLKCWLASMVQFPLLPLPYLFIYGPENSGKTVLQESLKMLFTRGAVARADQALLSENGFNAEMEHAILCAIEEVDLSKGDKPYLRMKDWLTSQEILIHPKGKTPYLRPNSAHFLQFSNDSSYCPIFPGDTRIVVIRVDPFEPGQRIPRKHFDDMLRKEAADFLGELISIELPETNDRLNIPIVSTEEKVEAQESRANDIEIFLRENLFLIPGSRILLSEIRDRYHKTLQSHERIIWNSRKVGEFIRHPFHKGRDRNNNQVYVINVSWDKNTLPDRPYIIKKVDDTNKIYFEDELNGHPSNFQS